MRRLIDPEVMRISEAEFFRASGVPSIEVMERAALALADAALERFPDAFPPSIPIYSIAIFSSKYKKIPTRGNICAIIFTGKSNLMR